MVAVRKDLRQRPARRQRRPRIQPGRHDADDVAPLIHQRPARIARLHRRADLKIPRVIPRAGQRRESVKRLIFLTSRLILSTAIE